MTEQENTKELLRLKGAIVNASITAQTEPLA
jgi:hypothetical protein